MRFRSCVGVGNGEEDGNGKEVDKEYRDSGGEDESMVRKEINNTEIMEEKMNQWLGRR